MKKKLYILSFLILLFFIGCNRANKNQDPLFADLNTDFPTSEKLEFKSLTKFDILEMGNCLIDGSTLWYFGEDEHSIGSCYDLNTGDELSVIATRGRAINELIGLEGCKIIGDSIQFYTNPNTIKTFSKEDILMNKPVGERKFSVTTVPDSIFARRMIKLPNGSVIATIETSLGVSEISKKSVVLFNNNEANTYETIKYNSADVEGTSSEMDTDKLIQCAYANGDIEVKGNDMAVFSVSNQFILYTFDINSGNVVKERRYTKIQSEGGGSLSTKNDMGLRIGVMKPNDKYILCVVGGYFSEKDKEANLQKLALFVFDWDLNPIKKFDLPMQKNSKYIISNDCTSMYIGEYTDDGFTLTKADLTI